MHHYDPLWGGDRRPLIDGCAGAVTTLVYRVEAEMLYPTQNGRAAPTWLRWRGVNVSHLTKCLTHSFATQVKAAQSRPTQERFQCLLQQKSQDCMCMYGICTFTSATMTVEHGGGPFASLVPFKVKLLYCDDDGSELVINSI